MIGRNASQWRGYGQRDLGSKAKLASVDPTCGHEEMISVADHSCEVVTDENWCNLETNFKNCFKASEYSVDTVCSRLDSLKEIYFF